LRHVYRLAAYFKEWDVEGPNGFIHKLTMEQFWGWMEFNRLNPFLEERDDLRSAQIASITYNANVVNREDLKSPSDFMLPSIDEMIQKDIERKEEKERELEAVEDDASGTNVAQLEWKAQLTRMIGNRKPVETTIKA
jgi:hypothetical protein